MNVNNHVSLAVTADKLTVGGFARVDEVSSGNQFLMSHTNALGDGWALYFGISSSTRALNFLVYTAGTVTKTEAAAFTVGTWGHFVGVYDGTDIRLYVDGVLFGSPAAQTGNVAATTEDLKVGALGAAQLFGGRADDLRVFTNTALTAQQVADWNAGGRGYEPGGAPVDFTATPLLGTTNTVGRTPTTDIDGSIVLTPLRGTTNTSGRTPTLEVGGGVSLTPLIGTTNTSGRTPTLITDGGVQIVPLTGRTNTSGYFPSLRIDGNVSGVPELGITNTQGRTPTLQIGGGIELTPLTGRTNTSGRTPALDLGGGVFITPLLGTTSTSGRTPALQIGGGIVITTLLGQTDSAGRVPTLEATTLVIGSHRAVKIASGFYVVRTGI